MLTHTTMEDDDFEDNDLFLEKDIFEINMLGAANNGKLEEVIRQIDGGIHVDAMNAKGETALHIACRRNDMDMAKILLERDANVNSKSDDYNSPLHELTENDNQELAELLIKHGANVNIRDKIGWTPLHEACKKGHAEFVVFLLRNGANINAQDCKGYTALHIVCCKIKDDGCLSVLLSHRPDLTLKNKRGETAFELSHLFAGYQIERIMFSHCSTSRMDNGRLFIHHILGEGRYSWLPETNNQIGVKEVMKENQKAVEDIDPKTGLYPFGLAAAKDGDLDSSFELLRRTPYLLIDKGNCWK